MKRRTIRTSDGNTYLHKAHNWPPHYDDGMKDEILRRLNHAYLKIQPIALQGFQMSGELGTVIISCKGLFSDEMECAYLPKSKMSDAMEPLRNTIEEGAFHPMNKLHITLFYDIDAPDAFDPRCQVGIFYIGTAPA
jgi:hypothetical protein